MAYLLLEMMLEFADLGEINDLVVLVSSSLKWKVLIVRDIKVDWGLWLLSVRIIAENYWISTFQKNAQVVSNPLFVFYH
jgi:hypothetical protein